MTMIDPKETTYQRAKRGGGSEVRIGDLVERDGTQYRVTAVVRVSQSAAEDTGWGHLARCASGGWLYQMEPVVANSPEEQRR